VTRTEELTTHGVAHYLGGWGDRISGESADMERLCELVTSGVYIGRQVPAAEEASAQPKRCEWCLLAQFNCGELGDGLETHEWFVGRRLFFFIKREDLADRRFEKAWVLTR
jgi:uncharacterized protein YwqG